MEQEKLIERVSLLNKKIKKINMERVVIESKRELLVETLNKQVAEYKKKTGINLAGKSVKEIYSKATAEYNKLYEEINAEYETQRKVVDCIESGDIDEAKRLLGMDVEEEAEAEEETASVEEAIEELEVGDDFELEVDDSDEEESEDLEDYEEETLEEEDADEGDEAVEAEDGFADLEIEEIDLDDLSVEPEEVEVKEEPKKAKKTKKGMDNPFDKTDDIFEFVEKAEKKAGAKKVDEKKTEEKKAGDTDKVKAEKKAKAEPKKVEEGVESLADFFEDDDEILDFADGIDGLSLDFN
jgi:hypothetical protein